MYREQCELCLVSEILPYNLYLTLGIAKNI